MWVRHRLPVWRWRCLVLRWRRTLLLLYRRTIVLLPLAGLLRCLMMTMILMARVIMAIGTVTLRCRRGLGGKRVF